jgi:hypothetical protein
VHSDVRADHATDQAVSDVTKYAITIRLVIASQTDLPLGRCQAGVPRYRDAEALLGDQLRVVRAAIEVDEQA